MIGFLYLAKFVFFLKQPLYFAVFLNQNEPVFLLSPQPRNLLASGLLSPPAL